jgi:hypothetical protein
VLLTVAALAFLLYDILLTMDEEVSVGSESFDWAEDSSGFSDRVDVAVRATRCQSSTSSRLSRKRFSFTSCLYYFIRYYPVCVLVYAPLVPSPILADLGSAGPFSSSAPNSRPPSTLPRMLASSGRSGRASRLC